MCQPAGFQDLEACPRHGPLVPHSIHTYEKTAAALRPTLQQGYEAGAFHQFSFITPPCKTSRSSGCIF